MKDPHGDLNTTLQTRCPLWLRRKLEDKARKERRPVGWLLRQLLADALDEGSAPTP